MAVAWSNVDPGIIIGAYDKAKQQHSLCIWDLEVSLQGFEHPPALNPSRAGAGNGGRVGQGEKLVPHHAWEERPTDPQAGTTTANSEGSRKRPLQQYLAGECVNSIATFHHTNTLVLAGTSSKMIKCVDLRAPGQMELSGGSTATTTPVEGNLAFSLPTRSIFNLCTSALYPHLFASCEDGLSGTVKLWDTRFLRSSTNHPGLKTNVGYTNPAGTLAEEVCSYEAAGRGGVVALRWDQRESGQGGQRLGIGTKEGGVIMYDVLSGETVDSRQEAAEFGRSEGSTKGSQWTTLAGVKNSQWTTSDIWSLLRLMSDVT